MSTTTSLKKDAQQATDRAADAVRGATDKAADAVRGATEKAKDMASQAGHTLSQAADTVGHKAEQATASVGSGIQSLADTVRHKGPESGMLGKANEAVASTLEKAGEYIEDKNLSGMVNDMTECIRRNPIPALLIGVGVGFLLGRALRS